MTEEAMFGSRVMSIRFDSAAGGLARALREDTEHLRVLTGVRGWDAFWVFMYCAWAFTNYPPLTAGMFGLFVELMPFFSMRGDGVTALFVLSGFLLATPLAQWQAGQREWTHFELYLFRRVIRLFPTYYAQLAVLILLVCWTSGQAAVLLAALVISMLSCLVVERPFVHLRRYPCVA